MRVSNSPWSTAPSWLVSVSAKGGLRIVVPARRLRARGRGREQTPAAAAATDAEHERARVRASQVAVHQRHPQLWIFQVPSGCRQAVP